MTLTIQALQGEIRETNQEIHKLTTEMKNTYTTEEVAETLNATKIELGKLREYILQKKLKKFKRDTQDYQLGQVYTWTQQRREGRRGVRGGRRQPRGGRGVMTSAGTQRDHRRESSASSGYKPTRRGHSRRRANATTRSQTEGAELEDLGTNGREPGRQRLPVEEKENLVINLSSKELSTDEITVLNKGLGFVPTNKCDPFILQVEMYKFMRSLKLKMLFMDKDRGVLSQNKKEISYGKLKSRSTFNPNINNASIETFTNMVYNDIEKNLDKHVNSRNNNLKYKEREALKELQQNKDIVIKRADKGGGIVVMNKDDYLIETLINPPGRPIVSGVDSLLQPLAIYVDTYLQDILPKLDTCLKDTTQFLKIIKDTNLKADTAILCTIDVKDLYTSIRHEEGIECCREYLQKEKLQIQEVNFLCDCLDLILKRNYFRFDNTFYLQIQGMSMGANMAPAYANIYMHKFENEFILSHPVYNKYVGMWYRYVDDMFMVWTGSKELLSEFYNYINIILIHLGLLTKESGFKIAENAFSGGPLGELVQWSDLITSLYLLGHDVRISASIAELKEIMKKVVGNRSGCPTQGDKVVALIYIDIVGLSQFKKTLGPSWVHYQCMLRVLDSFGTEPEFNHAHYAQSKGHKTPWGKWNLNPQQFYTMFPHTPDNSFLGFVVEQHLNASDIRHMNDIKRQNQSLVYGKVDNFWKDWRTVTQGDYLPTAQPPSLREGTAALRIFQFFPTTAATEPRVFREPHSVLRAVPVKDTRVQFFAPQRGARVCAYARTRQGTCLRGAILDFSSTRAGVHRSSTSCDLPPDSHEPKEAAGRGSLHECSMEKPALVQYSADRSTSPECQDKNTYLDIIHTYMEVHGTVHEKGTIYLPNYVQNHDFNGTDSPIKSNELDSQFIQRERKENGIVSVQSVPAC
ncbi:hypothetical protein XELAEV_18046998mg [Xenopus laevis]|uniref:alpha-1,6-mannosyl-glycoprotein 6-beta-N-acetylglucosaminyltransferase n=1 Tax=Xenopus laevis TaxID=8355 RepID=A0A974BUG7_XENLA|nr:hypothetical protein XELAEV_18046998mg [Xenopus laevis]